MKAYIFTEGGKAIGWGHITRCIALYDAFESAKMPVELIVNADSTAADLLGGKRYRLSNWLKEKRLFEWITEEDIVIVDSYLAGFGFYERVSRFAQLCVFLDDNKRMDYPKAFILNGAPFAEHLGYPKRKGMVYLLGSRFVLLRKEFWRTRQKHIDEKVKSIMVTVGATDIRNIILELLDFLNVEFPTLLKNVIVGNGFRTIGKIKRLKYKRCNYIYNPSAEILKEVMLKSDIAISAGGQTLNELARVGVPTIAIKVADNQTDNIKGWQMAGFIYYAGGWGSNGIFENIKLSIGSLKDPTERQSRCRSVKKFIDGKGSRRVIDRILGRQTDCLEAPDE